MKNLILFLGLIFYSYSYCQTQVPDLSIPINFTFQFAPPLYMQVGLDSTATDCLDPQLGEQELPPIPPPGWEAVIGLPYPQCQNGLGDPIAVHKDFRYGELPFTGTKTHLFWFRSDLGVTIHWNLPNGVTGLLQDTFGGGLISVPMAGQDSFYVPYNFINELNMILYYNNVTPVELNSFTALVLQNEKVIQLNWATATETNNSHFEVERKLKNQDWEKIGEVNGAGTIAIPQSYSFKDDFSFKSYEGKILYRLKQVDFDGSFEYSKVISVEVNFIPEKFAISQNYPNPFNPNTTISYSIPKGEGNQVTIKVYDLLGKEVSTLVNEFKTPGNYQIAFNADGLTSGIYFYLYEAFDSNGMKIHSEVRKMTLLK